jgi:Rrf2 family protein
MLSQKAKYALRALLVMAENADDGPVHIADIAASEGISRKFLEAILLELRKKGLLISRRGARGGYRLARPADQIYFGEIIRNIDGPLAPLPCASVTAFQRCADCSDPDGCAIRWLMQRVQEATAGVLDNCTLADALGKRPVNNRANQTRTVMTASPIAPPRVSLPATKLSSRKSSSDIHRERQKNPK